MANADIRQGYKNAAWFTANPTIVLKQGQRVNLEQTGTYKLGDGVTQLSVLSFLGGGSSQTLAQTLALGKKTNQLPIESNNAKAKVSVLDLYTESKYDDGTAVSKTLNEASQALLSFDDGIADLGQVAITTGSASINHTTKVEITSPLIEISQAPTTPLGIANKAWVEGLGYITNVLGTVLTGFSAGAGTVAATDTILQAFNKIVGNIALKLTANVAITGATKTKITYDANGLVTSGTDATTADINDSTNRRYVTDAQLVVVGNTSGTNSGDETVNTIGTVINGATSATPNDTDLVMSVDASVAKKNTWTQIKAFLKTYFDTLYPSGSGSSTGTNTGDNAVNSNYSSLVTNATHTGDATGATALTVVALNGTNLAGLGTGVLKNTTGTGVPFISKVALTEPATLATLTIANNKTLTVNNSITLSGTDATVMTFPTTTATIARTDSAQTFTGVQTMTSPVINTSLELGHATDTTLTRSSAGVLAVEGVVIPSVSSTNTLTNKILTARVYSAANNASLTPEKNAYDIFHLTAMSAATTINNPSTTTPTDGMQIRFRFLDNGTARTLTWGTAYVAKGGIALPSTTVISKNLMLGFEYNSNLAKWNLIASAPEA